MDSNAVSFTWDERKARTPARRGRLLLHQPMAGVRDHDFRDIAGGEAHHRRHGRAEDFSPPTASTGMVSLPFVEEGLVVDRVLVEGRELGEARVHRAGQRVKLGVVFARGFAER